VSKRDPAVIQALAARFKLSVTTIEEIIAACDLQGHGSFSVEEFCYRHGISKATYHNLKHDNKAPREMNLRGCIRISL
jgi:hypothetical protein